MDLRDIQMCMYDCELGDVTDKLQTKHKIFGAIYMKLM